MDFTADKNSDGSYTLRNTTTGEHMTVDNAGEISAAIDLYNQGVIDKQNAANAAAAAAAAPAGTPVADPVADPLGAVAPAAPSVADLEAQLAAAKAAEAAAVTDLTGGPVAGSTPAPVSNAN